MQPPVAPGNPGHEVTAWSSCLGRERRAPGDQTASSSMHPAAFSSMQSYKPGETVFPEGDYSESVYEVVRGMVRLYRLLPDGRRQITGFASAGNLIGLAPEGLCLYAAEAITEVALRRYKRTGIERMIDQDPGFARRLLAVTSHELQAAQDQIVLLGRKSAAEKVASFLLLMADRHGRKSDTQVMLPMSRGDIADYLGLTIETVSRTMTKLKIDGLVAMRTAAHVEIRNRGKLEELAAGECCMA